MTQIKTQFYKDGNINKSISKSAPIPVQTTPSADIDIINSLSTNSAPITYLDENDIVNRRIDYILIQSPDSSVTIKEQYIWGGVPGDYYLIDIQRTSI